MRERKNRSNQDNAGAALGGDTGTPGATGTGRVTKTPLEPLERLEAPTDKAYNEEPAVEAFRKLYRIIRILRAPDGCPWDREQTPESMKESLVEEAYEVVGAFLDQDYAEVREELGDTVLVATMISYMLEQAGSGTVSGVLEAVSEKLVRRHPHVFGEDAGSMGSAEVLRQWDDIKASEGKKRRSILEHGKTRGLPPLSRAVKLQKKASKLGFDWDRSEPVFEKVSEELIELRSAYEAGDHDGAERELGDLLFSVANLARLLKHDPSVALHAGNEKFVERFEHVAGEMEKRGIPMDGDNLAEMELLWQAAKEEQAAKEQQAAERQDRAITESDITQS